MQEQLNVKQESTVGRFGDGTTQFKPVSSKYMPRLYPSIGMTVKLQLMPYSSLKSLAHSPRVSPYLCVMGYRPIKDLHDKSSMFPSTTSAPKGFGLSNTINSLPFSAQACIA
jgi:hypothetical protein